MATTSAVDVTPGLGDHVATFSISEDAETKKVQRVAIADPLGADILGSETDAAATATDATPVSAVSLWKQISKSAQAIATALAGVLSFQMSNSGISRVGSTAAEASHVLKSSAGSLYALTVVTGATSGWLMLFDAVSAPADGAVTPFWAKYLPSDGTAGDLSLEWSVPLAFATGITAVFSSTGPFTKTGSTTAAFYGQVK